MSKSAKMFDALVQAGVTGYMIPIMEIGDISDHARKLVRDEGLPPALLPKAVADYCAERYERV